MRRPPPIAGLFALLAAGLALIAVAAWGGGARVPAFAAAVLAAWMVGLVVKLLRGPRRPPPEDSRIQ
jgi:hypothetical protein